MLSANAVQIVEAGELAGALNGLPDLDMGERGRAFYEGMAGATERTLAALLELLK